MKLKVKNIKLRNGFTLVELIVAIGISTMVLLGSASLVIYGLQYRAIIWEQLFTQNEGRKIVQDFVNEIRRANYSSVGAYPFDTVDGQEIIFYSNVDSDSWRERIRYTLDGSILKKGVTKPSGNPLVYNLANEVVTEMVHDVVDGGTPIFYYYNQNYNGGGEFMVQPVNPVTVRMVKIVLLLEADPHMSPEPIEVEASSEIRNLKTN